MSLLSFRGLVRAATKRNIKIVSIHTRPELDAKSCPAALYMFLTGRSYDDVPLLWGLNKNTDTELRKVVSIECGFEGLDNDYNGVIQRYYNIGKRLRKFTNSEEYKKQFDVST